MAFENKEQIDDLIAERQSDESIIELMEEFNQSLENLLLQIKDTQQSAEEALAAVKKLLQ